MTSHEPYPKKNVQELLGQDAFTIGSCSYLMNWDIDYAARKLDKILTKHGY